LAPTRHAVAQYNGSQSGPDRHAHKHQLLQRTGASTTPASASTPCVHRLRAMMCCGNTHQRIHVDAVVIPGVAGGVAVVRVVDREASRTARQLDLPGNDFDWPMIPNSVLISSPLRPRSVVTGVDLLKMRPSPQHGTGGRRCSANECRLRVDAIAAIGRADQPAVGQEWISTGSVVSNGGAHKSGSPASIAPAKSSENAHVGDPDMPAIAS